MSSPDKKVKIKISLKDAFNGAKINKSMPRVQNVPRNGYGYCNPADIIEYKHCDGKGMVTQMNKLVL